MKVDIVFAFMLALLSAGMLNAGTVSLTGTCSHALGSNTVVFSLSNSGNDSAYSVHVLPTIKDATAVGTSYDIGVLGPNSSSTTGVNLTNVYARGTYADYFTVAYQQGSQTFIALFPCLLDFGTTANSSILLSYNITYSGGREIIAVNALNAGDSELDATIYPILPPSFSYISNRSENVRIMPLKYATARFIVEPESSGASYSGAVTATYAFNGTDYATLSTLTLTEKGSSGGIVYVPLFIAAAAVVLILALILRIALKGRKKKKSTR